MGVWTTAAHLVFRHFCFRATHLEQHRYTRSVAVRTRSMDGRRVVLALPPVEGRTCACQVSVSSVTCAPFGRTFSNQMLAFLWEAFSRGSV